MPAMNARAQDGGDSKYKTKERILRVMTKMNDRDTARAAADELFAIALETSVDTLPTIVTCLCTTGPEQKASARKESARAIGFLVNDLSKACEAALQPPHLAKLLSQLRKTLQDSDSSVRDAAVDALSSIAFALSSKTSALLPGSMTNPVIRLIFESLAEQKKELTVSAGTVLGNVAPCIAQLDTTLVKELLQKIKNPAFQGTHALLSAIAKTEPITHEPSGLVKNGPGAFLPNLNHLIGSAPANGSNGSGIVGCLYRQEWIIRKFAADCLKGIGILLGSQIEPEGSWDTKDPRSLTGRCVKALETCKFDKVKDVRTSAREALFVLETLQQCVKDQSVPDSEWPTFMKQKLIAGNGGTTPGLSPILASTPPQYRRAPSPPTRRSVPQRPSGNFQTPTSPTYASKGSPRNSPVRHSSPFEREGSIAERFRKAHIRDEVFDDVTGTERAPSTATREPASSAVDQGEDDPELDASLTLANGTLSPRGISPVGSILQRSSTMGSKQNDGKVADDVDERPQLGSVTVSPQISIKSRQSSIRRQPSLEPADNKAGPAHHEPENSSEYVMVPKNEWAALQEELARMVREQQRLSEQVKELQASRALSPSRNTEEPASPRNDNAPSPMSSPVGGVVSYKYSDDVSPSYVRRNPSSAMRPSGSTPRRSPLRSPLQNNYVAWSVSADGTPTTLGPDIDATYAEGLSQRKGLVHMARLMQKTGPVWRELSQNTSVQLLNLFIESLKDHVMVNKILPWLWRLADDRQMDFEVPEELKGQLLTSLHGLLQNASDDMGVERVQLLLQSLRTRWNMGFDLEGTSL